LPLISTIIAVSSLVSALVLGLSALRIARSFQRHRPAWIDETVEEYMETFLKPNPDGDSLIDGIVDKVSERFGKGFRMSLMAQKSGEVRHANMIEKRVFEAALDKSPELKIGMKVLDELGLGDLATPENLPALLQIANKYGLFGLMKGNSPGESGHSGVM